MKRFLLAAAFTALSASALFAANTVSTDSIAYDVAYRWGFIDKTAAHGVVKYSIDADTLSATIAGRSIAWDGRIYAVADTLQAVFSPDTVGAPLGRERVTLLRGRYMNYAAGQSVDTDTVPYRDINGQGSLKTDSGTMEAVTIVGYMLSLYRIVQVIPFDNITPGWTATVLIAMPSPMTDESLTITYKDSTTFTATGSSIPAYSLQAAFTYKGAPSNYPLTVVIDAATRRVLSISAALRLGHIQMQVK